MDCKGLKALHSLDVYKCDFALVLEDTNALSAGRILSIPFCVWLDFIDIVTFLVSGSNGQLQLMNLFPKKEDVVNTLSPIKNQADDIGEFLTAVVVPDKVSLYHNVVV